MIEHWLKVMTRAKKGEIGIIFDIPNLASIQSVAFRWAIPGAAKCLWPKQIFKLNSRFLN